MSREMTIVEAVVNNKVIGRFVNMNTAITELKGVKEPVGYRFIRISEKSDKDFWTLIRKYYVLPKTR